MSKAAASKGAGKRAAVSQTREAQAIFLGALVLFASMIGLIRYLKSQQEAERASAPPKMTSYVMDEAHLIDPAVRAQLNERLRALYRANGPQVVVATIAHVTKGSIAEDAITRARAWRIGHAGRNDGVLLLIAANERKARIEVGYGLEGSLTDAASRLIIENDMERHLQAGEWTQAAVGGVEGVLDVVGKTVVAPNAGRPEPEASLPWRILVGAGKAILIAVFFVAMALFFFAVVSVILSILRTILLAIPGVGPRIRASQRWSWLAKPLPVRPAGSGGSSSSDVSSGGDWSSSSSDSSSSSSDSGGGGDFGGGGSNDRARLITRPRASIVAT